MSEPETGTHGTRVTWAHREFVCSRAFTGNRVSGRGASGTPRFLRDSARGEEGFQAEARRLCWPGGRGQHLTRLHSLVTHRAYKDGVSNWRVVMGTRDPLAQHNSQRVTNTLGTQNSTTASDPPCARFCQVPQAMVTLGGRQMGAAEQKAGAVCPGALQNHQSGYLQARLCYLEAL